MRLEKPLKAALNQYYPALAVEKISRIDQGLSNFNFLLENSEGRKIFAKVFRDANAQDASRETGLIAYLGGAGIPTPQIYKTASGAAYGRIAKKPVILYAYLEGHHPEASLENVAAIGHLMASIHVLPVSNDMQSRDQNYDALQLQLRDIVRQRGSFEPLLLLKALERCRAVSNSQSRKGIVHTDIFLDNCIKVSGSGIYLLDFEKAGFDCFLLDIGRAIIGCCLRDGIIDFHLARHLIKAYAGLNPLTSTEWNELYAWLIYALLISIVWRYIEFNLKRPCEGRQTLYQAFMPALKQLMAFDQNRLFELLHPQSCETT